MSVDFKNEIFEGEIIKVKNYGAIIDVEKIGTGLLHISEITNRYIENIHDYLKCGEKIKVKILELDTKKNKIRFTAKIQNPRSNLSKEQFNEQIEFEPLKRKMNKFIKDAKYKYKII